MARPAGVGVRVLAGCLAAWALAGAGHPAAGQTDGLAETLEQLTGGMVSFDPGQDLYLIELEGPGHAVRVAGVRLGEGPGLATTARLAIRESASCLEAAATVPADQVNPALDAVLDHGLNPQELGQLSLWDSPRMFRLVFAGRGKPEALAESLGQIYRVAQSSCPGAPVRGPLEGAWLPAAVWNQLLGGCGQALAGKYWIRTYHPGDREMLLPGATAWAVIWGSRNTAVVDAAWGLPPALVAGHCRRLRAAGLFITAIYPHPFGARPTVVVRAWGRGTMEAIATAVRELFPAAPPK